VPWAVTEPNGWLRSARSVIGRDYDTLARPRQSGPRAGLRVLLASRSIIDQQRTAN
jgi:hypothetical protein